MKEITFLEAILAGVKRCCDPPPAPKRGRKKTESAYKPYTITLEAYWERHLDEISVSLDKETIEAAFREAHLERAKKKDRF